MTKCRRCGGCCISVGEVVTSLIERLEAATGPDRELDAEVYGAAWGEPPPAADLENRFPNYTGSLDAALTLVPEGWKFVVRTDNPAILVGAAAYAGVGSKTEHSEATASTPAIALCIAALKARQG